MPPDCAAPAGRTLLNFAAVNLIAPKLTVATDSSWLRIQADPVA